MFCFLLALQGMVINSTAIIESANVIVNFFMFSVFTLADGKVTEFIAVYLPVLYVKGGPIVHVVTFRIPKFRSKLE